MAVLRWALASGFLVGICSSTLFLGAFLIRKLNLGFGKSSAMSKLLFSQVNDFNVDKTGSRCENFLKW